MDFYNEFLKVLQQLPEDIQKQNNLMHKTEDIAFKRRAIKTLQKYIQDTQNLQPSAAAQMSAQLSATQLQTIITNISIVINDLLEKKDQLLSQQEEFKSKIDNVQSIFDQMILHGKISASSIDNIDIIEYKARNKRLEEINRQLQEEIANLKTHCETDDDEFVQKLFPNMTTSTSQFGYDQVQEEGEKMVNYEKYRELKNKYRQIHDSNKVMKVQIKMYQEQLANMDPLLKQYEEKQNVDQLCSALNESNNQMRISTSNLFLKNQQLQRVINEKDKEIKDKLQHIQVLQDQIKRLRNLSSNFVDNRKGHPWVISDLTLIDDFPTQDLQNQQAKQKVSTVDRANSELLDADQVSNLKMQIVKLNQEIEDLKSDLKKRDETIQQQKQECQKKDNYLKLFETRIFKQDEDIRTLYQLGKYLNQICNKNTISQAQYEHKIDEAKLQYAEMLQTQYTQMKAKESEGTQKITAIISVLQNKLSGMHVTSSEVTEISFTINQLIAKIRILICQKQNLLTQLKSQENAYKNKISQLEKQVSLLQNSNEAALKVKNASFNLSNDDVSLLKLQIEQLEKEVAANQQIINIKDGLLEKKQSIIEEQQEQLNELGQSLISQSQLLQQQKSHIDHQAQQLQEHVGIMQYQDEVNERQRLQISALLGGDEQEQPALGSKATGLSMHLYAAGTTSRNSPESVHSQMSRSAKASSSSNKHAEIPRNHVKASHYNDIHQSSHRGVHMQIEDLGGAGTSGRRRHKSEQMAKIIAEKEEAEDQLIKERLENKKLSNKYKVLINGAIVCIFIVLLGIITLQLNLNIQKKLVNAHTTTIDNLKTRLTQCLNSKNQMQADAATCTRILSHNNLDLQSLNDLIQNNNKHVTSCQKNNKQLLYALITSSLTAIGGILGAIFKR